MRRREFVVGALSTGALVTTVPAASATPFAADALSGAVPYGAAIRIDELSDDLYREAVCTYCKVIVAEGSMKWSDLQAVRGSFTFELTDTLLTFAQDNDIELRGHTLAWYAALPEWAEGISSPEEARTELVHHIETVVGRYKGRIRSWDVVNEAIAHDPTRDAPFRDSVWLKHLGPDYIELALRTAAAADPGAQLVINDYDFEMPTDQSRAKRKAFLDMVRGLKSRNVPLHAVGLQGHLRGEHAVDTSGISSFVAELSALGLGILVTELDVIDDQLPGLIEERDKIVAARAREFLSAIGTVVRPEIVVTWGVSDQHSWVPIWFTRQDGMPNRPLPLDENYQPKELMRVIQDFTQSFA